MNNSTVLGLLIFFAFIIRLLPINFPLFTEDEARIAYRGYSLAATGKDELGRPYPLLLNSLEDYQLPATSYLAAIGIKVFGKSDFGVRLPFILIGTALVLLTYLVAKFFSKNFFFRFISGLVVALSPPLIFLSKTPNEIIVLTFIFTLLFYLLINNKDLRVTLIVMITAVLISKIAWFVLVPFTLFTVFSFNKKLNREGIFLVCASVVIVFTVLSLFLTIPQSKRSLLENNFSIFNDVTIKNGINKLRGQGMASGWPALLDRILFNKVHLLLTGLLHWVATFNPAIYFGHFDATGTASFSFVGAFPKILIIPAMFGLFSQSVFLYIPLLTLPALFIYPKLSLALNVLTIPFLAILIAFGFMSLNKRVTGAVLFLMVFEIIINIYNFPAEYKNTDDTRPTWIKSVSMAVFNSAKEYPVAISDNVVSDVVPFIEWYNPIDLQNKPSDVGWPYKFRQYSLENIKIIGSGDKFRTCGTDEHEILFVSKRDLSRIKDVFEVKVIKSYQDSLGKDKAYFLSNNLCIN